MLCCDLQSLEISRLSEDNRKQSDSLKEATSEAAALRHEHDSSMANEREKRASLEQELLTSRSRVEELGSRLESTEESMRKAEEELGNTKKQVSTLLLIES